MSIIVVHIINMKRSNKNVVQKKRGRPATGQDPITALRLSADLREKVDAWAGKQGDKLGRSKAIRQLIEMGLAAAPARPAKSQAASKIKASDLAGKAIDRLQHRGAAPEEERARRKRRLLKGPSEFREMREDLPKKKR